MNVKCPVCGSVEEISWQVEAFFLVQLSITYSCSHCKSVNIVFHNVADGVTEVKNQRPDYVG